MAQCWRRSSGQPASTRSRLSAGPPASSRRSPRTSSGWVTHRNGLGPSGSAGPETTLLALLTMWDSRGAAKVDLHFAERLADEAELPGYELCRFAGRVQI